MMKTKASYSLSDAVLAAIEKLAAKGYAFPTSTKSGTVEKAVRDAWEEFFPGEPFPEGKKESR